jgi:iron complex transport system substrate-binding protein
MRARRPARPQLAPVRCAVVRVVSLLPSATEIVAELGCVDLLVGRSEECDWPPDVLSLPTVSRARVDTRSLASHEVDDVVRKAIEGGRSLYVVDESLLRSLAPDLVLTQDLCAVCAVASGELCALDVPTLSLDPRTLDDIAESVELVAVALGVPDRGRERAVRMRRELDAVRASVAGLDRPRVFVAEWVDPPYAPGHWIPELVSVAGGECVLGSSGEHSFRVDWDDVRAARPDVLVLAPCGYDAERAAAEPFPADVAPRVVAVDASAYYARPAPRVVDGGRQLAHLLHPEDVPDPGVPVVECAPAPV